MKFAQHTWDFFSNKFLTQICSDTHEQLAAAQYNRLPVLANLVLASFVI